MRGDGPDPTTEKPARSGSASAQESAAATLANLAVIADNAAAIAKAGGIPLLIALLDVSSFADPFLTPWSMVIEIPTHHGVWIGSASSLRTTYEAFSLPPKRLAFLTPYAEGRARRRTSIIRQMSGLSLIHI